MRTSKHGPPATTIFSFGTRLQNTSAGCHSPLNCRKHQSGQRPHGRDDVLEGFSRRGTSTTAVRDVTLGQLLEQAARSAPDRLALIAGVPDPAARRQWTYAELARRGAAHRARAAAPLRAGRAGRGLGAQLAGMGHGGVRRRDGRRRAGDRQSRLPRPRGRVRPEPVARGRRVRRAGVPRQPDAAIRCISSRRTARNCARSSASTTGTRSSPTGDEANIALPDVKPTDPVMIQYTSGTTGFPKGALLHHRGLVNNGAHTADALRHRADGDVYVTTMPLFHTGGCVCCVLGAVSQRMTQVLVEAFEPGLVLELFATYRGNAMLGVPTMLMAMMEHPVLRHDRPVVAQGDLLRRLDGAGRGGAPRSRRSSACRSRSCSARPSARRSAMTWTDRHHRGQGGHASARRCRTPRSRSSIPTPARPCRSARSARSARAAIT